MSHAKASNSSSITKMNCNPFGETSSIFKENYAESIHEENVQLLSGMDESEILAERQQLLETIGENFQK